ncbi:fibrobacter succinogenes major paralogous domain-containing protein [Patescibacteria group bacterium]|nr:fibrobacter succinogenes major paralogous domain-containing protein [Patescibacteria group bacterium]
MEFEEKNFRVNSDGWEKRTRDGQEYLVNPLSDIWQLIGGKADGEQLFTWDAAIRETRKVGKRMPTDKEVEQALKSSDMPNLVLAGYRYDNRVFNGQGDRAYFWWFGKLSSSDFNGQGDRAYFWLSTESSYDTPKAWAFRLPLEVFDPRPMKALVKKTDAFSIRCLKD